MNLWQALSVHYMYSLLYSSQYHHETVRDCISYPHITNKESEAPRNFVTTKYIQLENEAGIST